MNYLAHFHLSFGDDDLLLGALLGDFVKGPLKGIRDYKIEQGILLHRKIDAFTDSHPGLRNTHQLFEPRFRRYAGIMTDVAFDYFLNQYWNDFHPQPLSIFSQHIYQLIDNNQELTEPAQRQADNLILHDVFDKYQHWQTVARALSNIGNRIRGANPLDEAAHEMQRHFSSLENQFLDFYPQLQKHVAQIRSNLR